MSAPIVLASPAAPAADESAEVRGPAPSARSCRPASSNRGMIVSMRAGSRVTSSAGDRRRPRPSSTRRSPSDRRAHRSENRRSRRRRPARIGHGALDESPAQADLELGLDLEGGHPKGQMFGCRAAQVSVVRGGTETSVDRGLGPCRGGGGLAEPVDGLRGELLGRAIVNASGGSTMGDSAISMPPVRDRLRCSCIRSSAAEPARNGEPTAVSCSADADGRPLAGLL